MKGDPGIQGVQGQKGDIGLTGPQATGLWAVGRADGTLGAHSSHVTSSSGSAGVYVVTFDQDVSGCAFLGTPTETSPGTISSNSEQVITSRPSSISTNTVRVAVYDAAGSALAAGDYSLAVFC